jgi:hypothetical protein
LPQVLVLQAKSEQSKRENYHMSILGLSKAWVFIYLFWDESIKDAYIKEK